MTADVPATVHVRAARPADARALAEAWFQGEARSLLEGYPKGHPDEWFWMKDVEQLEETWVRSLAAPDPFARTFVAEVATRVSGFAQTGPTAGNDGLGLLRSLYVHPDAWGHGCGSALHEACIAELGARFERAELWVIEANQRARTFYERRGWTHDGQFMRTENGLPLVRYVRTVP